MSCHSHDKSCIMQCSSCEHWPYVHDAHFESCRYYSTSKECIESHYNAKENKYSFSLKNIVSIFNSSACIQCSLMLLMPTKNLTYEFGHTINEYIQEMPPSWIFLSIFNREHITIFKRFLTQKMYFKNFMRTIDALICYCERVPSDIKFQMQLCKFINSSSRLECVQIAESTKQKLYEKLFIFLKLFNRKRHVLWLIQIKNGYYFDKYVIQSYKQLRLKHDQLSDSSAASVTQWAFTEIFFYGPMKCLQKYRENIFRYLQLNVKKQSHVYNWLFKNYDALTRCQTGFCFECFLDNMKCVQYSKVHYYSFVKCNNRLCNNTYYPFVYGFEFKNKTMDEWDRLYVLKKLKKINKFFKCGQCKMTFYCSRRCQKYDWKFGHRDVCRYFA
eukprot:242652_1